MLLFMFTFASYSRLHYLCIVDVLQYVRSVVEVNNFFKCREDARVNCSQQNPEFLFTPEILVRGQNRRRR
jgi:hypothetical protein